MLFFCITNLLWVGGVNVEGGAIHFSRWMEGGRSFFLGEGRGGEGFFKVETKVPEEDFSNSIAWSLKHKLQ